MPVSIPTNNEIEIGIDNESDIWCKPFYIDLNPDLIDQGIPMYQM